MKQTTNKRNDKQDTTKKEEQTKNRETRQTIQKGRKNDKQ